MKTGSTRILGALSLAVALIAPGAASAITLSLSWTGSNGYSMTGSFSYADSLIGTGIIDETSISALTIEGFDNGTSLGTWSLADGSDSTDPFNFNFDTTNLTFIIGGVSGSPSGQAWNRRATGIGFESGDKNQILTLNGNIIADSALSVSASTLTVTAVPVPAALYLFASGLFGIVGVARRNRNTAIQQS